MVSEIPIPSDYQISPEYGFLPAVPPLERLSNPFYDPWEEVAHNLPKLISGLGVRSVVRSLPTLPTLYLKEEVEWQRAYSLLNYVAHGFLRAGNIVVDRLPANLSTPLLAVSKHLDLPPVATYAAIVLWNFKPHCSTGHKSLGLENLTNVNSFTGSKDESWFVSVSVAFEAQSAPVIPLMLHAFRAARAKNSFIVTSCLQAFAKRLSGLGILLERIFDGCDPSVFYHKIRPFLAGSKNMADLPNGVVYEDGTGKEKFRQYCGGSNAQSSVLQFFDIALGLHHQDHAGKGEISAFHQEMREYMPGEHRRFLEVVDNVANIRGFVKVHGPNHTALSVAYNACLTELKEFRNKHMIIVSRYIIRQSLKVQRQAPIDSTSTRVKTAPGANPTSKSKRLLVGTGGTALVSFLEAARDSTSRLITSGR